ncbi:MAG: excinuclease ABC subunit UvrC [Chloroflexota bacterium]
MPSSLITEQLQHLPPQPGVYLFKDSGGNILYVGKAASLRARVRSYFQKGQQVTHKLQQLATRTGEIEFYITGSEQEALILELNLVQRHNPPFNVLLKDGKTFPYLKISTEEEFPRVYVTRRPRGDEGRYFGPFSSAHSVRQTLKVLRGIFPFRNCTRHITGKDPRPCLEFHMGRCLAPCTGAAGAREYAEVIRAVTHFLEGKRDSIIREMERKMRRAAKDLDFEKAARYRDRIQAMKQVIEGEHIATTVRGEQDAIAFATEKDLAFVQVFLVRQDKLVGRESFVLQGARDETPREIMTGFIKQFYATNPSIPPQLLLQYAVTEKTVLTEWLLGKRGGPVSIRVPRRGPKKELLDIVAENARQGLAQLKIKQSTTPRDVEAALEEIGRILNLKGPPQRMEAYDISNIQGRSAVGSMVVFEKGRPKPAHYRRFRIRTVTGADDYAMLREVIQRRFRPRDRGGTTTPDSWALQPDLVLIDGGKGQLNAVLAAVGAASPVPFASLAKENEAIFLPHRKDPILLPDSSAALHMLQRLRDEAHRFAIGYHTRLRHREGLTSRLDAVPGIGPKRRRKLLQHFGSVSAIRDASVTALAAAAGVSEEQANKIKEQL